MSQSQRAARTVPLHLFTGDAGASVLKRKPAFDNWPTFDAPLLQSIAAAFLLRRKAIAYQAGLCCQRDCSESATGAVERLNLDLHAGHTRLSVWADGVMWLAVCVRGFGRGAGWAFKDAFHGDVRDVSPETMVGMVEATLALPLGDNTESGCGQQQIIRSVWARVSPNAG